MTARRTPSAPEPVGQLSGRLAGEGDGQDVARLDAPLRRQPGDPPGEDPGLPRAGPGQDGQRGDWSGDGLPLTIVQIGQELVGIAHGATVPAGCDRNGDALSSP